MAIKTITVTNFRGQDYRELSFPNQVSIISGPNGIGKSTVKEAIAFAYAGTDSNGTRSPKHLISNGQNDCSVVIETDRSIISRTLTSKGNGTIKLTRNGIPTTLNQTQLEQMIGSTDLFLSCLIPGYFQKLQPESKQKVLAEVLPKTDRYEILEELCGIKLHQEERLRYDLSRRTDLVASSVSTDRRNIERDIDKMSGEVSSLNNVKKPDSEPSDNGAVHRLQCVLDAKNKWANYEKEVSLHNHRLSALDNRKKEIVELKQRAANLQQELNGLVQVEVPKYEPIPSKALMSLPVKPHTANELNFDQCPTCGHKVSSKQKQDVTDRNKKILSDYEAELKKAEDFNTAIRDENNEIAKKNGEAYNKHCEAVMKNRAVTARRVALEKELQGIDLSVDSCELNPPVAPSEVFDKDECDRLSAAVVKYNQEVGAYDFMMKNYEKAQQRLVEINTKLEPFKTQVARLALIEANIKNIVNVELKAMSEAMSLNDVSMIVGENIMMFNGDQPYSLLSTGQKMYVDIHVCAKLNMLSKRVNMIFVDDANLINNIPSVGNIQVFVANVDPSLNQIVVL